MCGGLLPPSVSQCHLADFCSKFVGGFFFNMYVVQEVHVNGGGGHHGDHQETAAMDMEDMEWKPQVSFLSTF
jgi:hypothetical protein